ncbi:UNKNOWN [Stylonychia lemnae]|uniref:TLDc domain-containing protein n=1 Tax=Stylonychia lemnae TaxID=5949 RepID=A0A078AQF2_STYLE|nr:UNKNOWN [Stylonychia lemnae]|eukprot:CDW84655.1 UNKNOWN [Stylonychia lemnae]
MNNKLQSTFKCPKDQELVIKSSISDLEDKDIQDYLAKQDYLGVRCHLHQDQLVEVYCTQTNNFFCEKCPINCNSPNHQSNEHERITREGFKVYLQETIPQLQDSINSIQSVTQDLLSIESGGSHLNGNQLLQMINYVRIVLSTNGQYVPIPVHQWLDVNHNRISSAKSNLISKNHSRHQVNQGNFELNIQNEERKGCQEEQRIRQQDQKFQNKSQDAVGNKNRQTQELQQSIHQSFGQKSKYEVFRQLVDNEKQGFGYLHQECLFKKYGSHVKFALKYKGSRDGYKAQDFHQRCNQQEDQATVCFILSNQGYVFGGYVTKKWTDESYWQDDKEAFIFSLSHQTIHRQNESADQQECAMKGGKNQGWTQGTDLQIDDECDVEDSCLCRLGSTYSQFNSLNKNDKNRYEHLAGSFNFHVLEIEVYQIYV